MRKMKDSGVEWIGEIPEEWNIIKGKYIFTQRMQRGNIIELQLLSPTQKYGVIPQEKYEELSRMNAVKLNEKVNLALLKTIHKGDFCISLRSFQGGFEYSKYEGVVSPAYQVFYPSIPVIDTYYKYLFKDNCFIQKINSYSMTLRDGKNIAFADFGNTYIPMPSINDQRHIAEYLDSRCSEIDGLVSDIESQITTLEQYKRSVITEAVTKGLDPAVPMKDSGIEWIGEIPEEWGNQKIKYVATLSPRINYSFCRKKPVGYVPMECVKNGYMTPLEGDFDSFSSGLTPFQEDDIVMAKVTPCYENGNIAIAKGLPQRVAFGSSELFVLRSKSVDNIFLFYLLQSESMKDMCVTTMTGSGGLKRVSPYFLENVVIPFPPLSEQHAIADYLDTKCSEIDSAISLKKQQIEALNDYKKSLIYEYVTGKKEIPA